MIRLSIMKLVTYCYVELKLDCFTFKCMKLVLVTSCMVVKALILPLMVCFTISKTSQDEVPQQSYSGACN